MKEKTGILLINMGSPASPSVGDIKPFLREVLNDPRIMDIHPVLRTLIVNFAILPFRPRKTSALYKEVWLPEGSPLIVNTRNFTDKLRKILPDSYVVEFAMRYGQPAISEVLTNWRERGLTRLVIFPMYPQYASSTTGTALSKVFYEFSKTWNTPAYKIIIIPPIFDNPGYINTLAENTARFLNGKEWDHILFSFHSIPETHIKKSENLTGQCLSKNFNCCKNLSWENQYCYRAQCVHTAVNHASLMGLADDQYTISFQSKMGKGAWLKPYTDRTIQKLARNGCRNLAVVCPSFVADCLETLEEIGIRERQNFINAGGSNLHLVPSLNDSELWVQSAGEIIMDSVKSK